MCALKVRSCVCVLLVRACVCVLLIYVDVFVHVFVYLYRVTHTRVYVCKDYLYVLVCKVNVCMRVFVRVRVWFICYKVGRRILFQHFLKSSQGFLSDNINIICNFTLLLSLLYICYKIVRFLFIVYAIGTVLKCLLFLKSYILSFGTLSYR